MTNGTIIKRVDIEQMGNGQFLMKTQYKDGLTDEIIGQNLEELRHRYSTAFNHWDWRMGGIHRIPTMIPAIELDPIDLIVHNEAYA